MKWIEDRKHQIAQGANPMDAKKELAHTIVRDFHSEAAAAQAAQDWARQFQKNETPESIEEVDLPLQEVSGAAQTSSDAKPQATAYPIRVDKLVARLGLTGSTSEASRKIKEKAVFIDGELVTSPLVHRGPLDGPYREVLVVRVGRKQKKAILQR
jgi:tyrosyl-tRNA synthetase